MKIFLFLLITTGISLAQDRALVDLTTGDVLGYKTTQKTVNPNPEQWVPVTINAQPAFNPDTQKLQKVVTVAPDKSSVTVTWNVVALSQAELDEKADNVARDTKQPTLAASIATLRSWALDAQSTTVTNGNNNVVTQTMVDRMGVFFDRFADLLEYQRVDK